MASRLKLFNVIFLAIGGLLLCISAFMAASRLRLEHTGLTAHGRVIRLEARSNDGISYYPVVQFLTHDEQEITFTSSSGSRPASFEVDEPVTVLYDPKDPHHAYIYTFMQFWGAAVILSGMGFVFTGVPTGILLSQARGRSRARWLKENGRLISTQFQSVERVKKITVDGDHPYRIVSRWQDPATNQQYVFHSFNLWHDPTPMIGNRSVDVFIDPNNPRRYWLDTDFLGDLAN